jgi:dipeptidyl aminopeptidase/acylaminoacyl peptidase
MPKKFIGFLISLLILILSLGSYFLVLNFDEENSIVSPVGLTSKFPKEKPLQKYSFENLSQREFVGSQIEIGEKLNEDTEKKDKFSSHIFFFESDERKVSGQINIPLTEKSQLMPVIIMLRGYVDQEIYHTGMGTERAAAVFAQNGYITLAPDFLGYGQSDMPENDVWWERFQNPVIVLNLLASIKNLPQADHEKIGIWAHSNGGQVAISILEITKKYYPTSLWAPVTKPFPYSILYFTDEFDDKGKMLRKELARLEEDYNVDNFCISNFFDQIKAPLLIHQGTNDDAVPVEWSNEFSQKLDDLEIDHNYYIYNGADHNMLDSWDLVVQRDLAFFKREL